MLYEIKVDAPADRSRQKDGTENLSGGSILNCPFLKLNSVYLLQQLLMKHHPWQFWHFKCGHNLASHSVLSLILMVIYIIWDP